ncbi:hypothetical protein Tco_0057982 [Tanacetum coccineum]
MANLEFCDIHDMVTYLKKIEGSEGFHHIVDFLNSSHIRTLDNGEMEITATIDGKVKIVSEASIRRHLKLKYSDGISNLPTTKIFEQLALMGYGPVVQGEGSTVPVESHHTPISALLTLQQPSSSPSKRTTRHESMVPQPRSPTQTNVADKAASTGVDDKTPSMPHDLPFLRVHTIGSDEGRMQHNELMDLVTKLSDRVVALETDLQQTKKVYGTTFTKLIKKVKKLEKTVKTRQARRKARIVGKHKYDMEPDFEFTTAEEVYTAKKEVSTAEPVFTASVLVSTVGASSSKYKVKAIMEEAETIQTKTKLQLEQERLDYEETLRLQAEIDEEERQRIARVQEEASSFNIEEWDNIQARVEADEEFAQRLQSEEKEMYSKAEKARLLAELINERKRYFVVQRAKEKRNEPLTQAQ